MRTLEFKEWMRHYDLQNVPGSTVLALFDKNNGLIQFIVGENDTDSEIEDMIKNVDPSATLQDYDLIILTDTAEKDPW